MMAGGAGGSGSDDGYGAFLHWLQSNYAKKEDMDKELAKVSEDITQRILTITKEQASNVYIQSDTKQGPAAAISEDVSLCTCSARNLPAWIMTRNNWT